METVSNYAGNATSGTYTIGGSIWPIDVACPYMGKCTDANMRCGTCANNQARRSFYVPEPWRPCDYWPWYPQPWITWTTQATDSITCGDTGGDLSGSTITGCDCANATPTNAIVTQSN